MQKLTTQRLILEPLMRGHADALYQGLSDQGLYRFLDDLPPKSLEALRRRYTMLEARRSPDLTEAWLNWAIRAKEPAIYVGYVQATIRDTDVANIGYVIFSRAWGNGYAREALTAMLDELAQSYKVRRVVASVDRLNERSLRLLRGMRFAELECRDDVSKAEVEFLKDLSA